MFGSIDDVEAAVHRKARKRIAKWIGKRAEGWRNVERTAERVLEHDAVQPAPAVVILIRRAGEGRGEVWTGRASERVGEALQDDDVAPIFG